MSGVQLLKHLQGIGRALEGWGYRLALALNIALVLSYIGFLVIVITRRLTWMADFTCWYTGAKIILTGAGGQLYDLSLQTAVQQRLLGGRHLADGLLPFNHPPHAALLMTPLALLPLEWAYGVWTLFNLGLWALLLWEIWQAHPDWSRRERIMAAAAWTASPFWMRAILLGSFSIWASFVLWRFSIAMRRHHERAAGLWLALGSIHPTVTLFPWLALAGARRGRALTAGMGAMALMAGIPTILLGPGIWRGFLDILRVTASARNHLGIHPGNMVNLRGMLFNVLGPDAWDWVQGMAWLGLIAGALLTMAIWRKISVASQQAMDLHMGWTILAGLFLSPHLNPQDGLLMGLPALWLYSALRETRASRHAFSAIAALSPTVFFLEEVLTGPGFEIRLPVLGMLALGIWIALAWQRHGSPGPTRPLERNNH